jgi:hypothetical protein
MNLHEAIEKAKQILDQERAEPTVSYTALESVAGIGAVLGNWTLAGERGKHPRTVRENPREFQFKSANFDLLCAILDQVSELDKPILFSSLHSRISDARSYRHIPGDLVKAGSWTRCSSELPLLTEFLVRRGDKQVFISCLGVAAPTPGLTLLLMQLEEMIALNFTLFTEKEYEQLPIAVANIKKITADLAKKPTPSITIDSNTRFHVVREIPPLCDAIPEECRKARYLYVKGSLLPGMNLEINQDKTKVRTFLEKLGFTQLLIESLDEAERLYRTAATPFELKSSMAHLRSFLEGLHLQACAAMHKKIGGALPSKWGESLQYLRDHDVLTAKEQQFVIQFYALVSDTSVHPLVAEREYARLIRNMSIEYGLLLLTKLDKLGLK